MGDSSCNVVGYGWCVRMGPCGIGMGHGGQVRAHEVTWSRNVADT